MLYSGLELEVWRLAEELDKAFDTRDGDPAWFEGPMDRLDHTRELLRVIDWPRDHPPAESIIEIDTYRDAMVSALRGERRARRDHRDAPGNGAELRDEARRAIAAIDGFFAKLPTLEAEADDHQLAKRKPDAPCTDPDGIEHVIVLQVLRDDHVEQWTRAELETELNDVEPLAARRVARAKRGLTGPARRARGSTPSDRDLRPAKDRSWSPRVLLDVSRIYHDFLPQPQVCGGAWE